MNSKDSILKFFYTDNPKPIIHLIEITKLIFSQINNNTEAEDIIKDIFSILKIDKTINEFLKDLEEILKLKVDKEKVEFKKKNDGFEETSFFRVYNALFWQLKVHFLLRGLYPPRDFSMQLLALPLQIFCVFLSKK